MILRDALVDNLELYESKSHKILSESVWRQLDEDTKNYVNRWEQELWPLLEEYEQLTEAELTADQILGIFGQAEKFALDSGKYQTKAGVAGEKAAQAGKAVVGGVKLASGVVSQINNKINELGKMIQDTTPVRNIDAAFEKAKKDLTVALGGKDSKIVASMEKLSELAQDHPGKAKFVVGLLTTAAAFAGGPAGGAAAGFVLRAGNDLLAGEKLSTAVGKSAKTAAIGALAGMAFNAIGDEVVNNIATAGEADLQAAEAAMKAANIQDAMTNIDPDLKAILPQASDLAQVELTGQINRFFYDYDVLLNPDQLAQYNSLRDAMSGFRGPDMFSDQYKQAAAEFHNWMAGVQADPNQSLLAQAAEALKAAQDTKLSGEQLLDIVGQSNSLDDKISSLATASDAIAAATQAAAQEVAATQQNAVKATEPKETEEPAKQESIDYDLIYTKHMAGIPLNESEQQVVNEIGLADIKKFASNAAAKVGDAAKKAGGAIAGGAKAAAKEIGNQITVKKLTDLWNKSGKPTDAQSVSNVLAQAGMEPGDVTQVSRALPAPTAQQQAQGAQRDAGRPGIPQQQAGEQPAQSGEQPAQQAPQGGTQQPAQQQQPAQGGAQGTPAPKTGAQGTTSGAAPQNTGEEPADNAINIRDGEKKSVNKIQFVWNAEQGEWLDPNGTPATGLMKQELMKQVNKDITGQPPKPGGIVQRAKDYMSGKTPGLAQATRSDPKSGIGRKLAGIAGAAIGGAMAGGKTPPQQQPAPQPGEQPAPQAGEQPAQGGLKPVPGPTTAELKALQSKTLQGDLESAKALVGKLSNLKNKGYDADTFIQAAAPAMKRGGLAKSDPQAYAHFVKLARSMRAEAYQHMNAILEYAGLTWEDLGYEVLVSEAVDSHVLLVPIEEIKMHEMKKLAGV